MGSLKENNENETLKIDSDCYDSEEEQEELKGEPWVFGNGSDYWQTKSTSIKDRIGMLLDNREMSDVVLLACDENWWFGDTVKDFSAHKLVLGSASPVLHYVLYELDEQTNPERRLLLDKKLGVTLTTKQCFDYVRLEMDGIPPIAASALLEYIYRDKFNQTDFENGYSRNLLWRLWHASQALEMDHLLDLCSKTIHNTMCEETVFWDLNYAMQYHHLGTDKVMKKVLQMSDAMKDKLFENPNFVWLEKEAVDELLRRRKSGTSDALTVFNNLLRWSLYQVDRTACSEIDGKSGSDIPVEHRLKWIQECRFGTNSDSVTKKELDKYLRRGLSRMPWQEMSQKDFLQFVVPYNILNEDQLLKESIQVMGVVVKNPDRLLNSAFHSDIEMANFNLKLNSPRHSPLLARKSVSRNNSLRKSITDVKLRRKLSKDEIVVPEITNISHSSSVKNASRPNSIALM